MRRLAAVFGTGVFFVVAPCVVAGLVPWGMTGWDTADDLSAWWLPLRALGAVLLAVSVVVLLEAFVRFVVEGAGTPAPVAPTERLVVRGLYRYVRNPMYLAVVGAIVGQAIVLGRPALLPYAVVVAAAVVSFVRWYEEPTLTHRFGDDYEAYRRTVPGWWPRRPRRPCRST